MQMDQERTQKLIEPKQAIVLHVTKNRGRRKRQARLRFFSRLFQIQRNLIRLLASDSKKLPPGFFW
jgi:hypothetical protein